MPTQFPNAVTRFASDKVGERPSALDFGALGDGSTDDAAAIRTALASVLSVGGAELYFPRGTYICNSPLDTLVGDNLNIRITGDGPSSIIKRGADMPTGQGLWDIAGTDITFSNILIDGDVTTPVGLQYGVDFNGVGGNDPMADSLTTNSSFWLHPGSKRVRFDNVWIQHTGGYAILLDARGGDIQDIKVLDCIFQNNRPHLFGTSGGDLNYGSWTGGIHYQCDGRASVPALFSVRNLLVRGCTFRRNTGNCVWGHLYGFDRLHANIRHENNHFEDCGLDGILVGGVVGGNVTGNTFRRVGYICLTDSDTSTPKYLANANATALDTSGVVRGVDYVGNTMISVNGGCMDLDGFCRGSITGNTCILPKSTDPEYVEDDIAAFGANVSYGANINNSVNNMGGEFVTITGNTFINLGGGAIRGYAARNCHIYDNNIDHPASPALPPIQIGNIGNGSLQRAYGNVIGENQIYWNPSSLSAAVKEDANGFAFQGSDKNWVLGQKLSGNCYEFLKDVNSGSTTEANYSTGSVSASRVELNFKREGTTSLAYSSWYKRIGSSAQALLLRAYDDPALFNVADNGAAGTGAFSTAGRTVLAIDDVMATGHLYGDGFLALTDATFTYPNDPSADVFADDTGLIRYNSTSKLFEQSTSVSAGHRVWTTLGGSGGTPAAPDRSIQFNNAGSFGGDDNFLYQVGGGLANVNLSVGATANSLAFSLNQGAESAFLAWVYNANPALGYGRLSSTRSWLFDAAEGPFQFFFRGATRISFNAIFGAAGSAGYASLFSMTSDTDSQCAFSFNVPTTSNGLRGYQIGGEATGEFFIYDATHNLDSFRIALDGNFTYQATDTINFNMHGRNRLYVTAINHGGGSAGWASYATIAADDGSQAAITLANTVSSVDKAFQIGIQTNGTFFIYDAGHSANLLFTDTAGQLYFFTGVANISTAGDGTFKTVTTTAGGVIQSGATGASIAFQTTNFNFQVDGNGNISGAGSINMTGANPYKVGGTTVIDAGRAATFASVTTSGGGVIQSSATGSSIAFQTTNFNFQVDGNGNISGAGSINMTGASPYKVGGTEIVSAARIGTFVGVHVTGSAFNSLQVPAGGCYASLGFTTDQALYLLTKGTGTQPNSPSGLYGAFGHRQGSTFWYFDGSSWNFVDFAVSGGGVSSLNGASGALTLIAGTGVSIAVGAPNITISIGQAVATSSSVTFANVTTGAGGVIQSGASGASIAFQTTNANFQVDGNGNVSGAGSANLNQGYKVGGTTIVNSSRAATFASVVTNAGGAFNSGASGSTIAFQTTNFNFQVDGNGNISGAGSANLNQGYKVGGNVSINSFNQFVGAGVDCNAGVAGTGFNIHGGIFFGQTTLVGYNKSAGGTGTLQFVGGILTASF